MKTFFRDFARSLHDKHWYKEIASGQHPFRIGYAVALALISALVVSVVFTIFLYAALIPQGKDFAAKHYPADLVITVKSGELSVNQQMPYRIAVTGEQKKGAEGKDNVIVIDTDAAATLDSPRKYDTYVFANKDTIMMQKSAGETRAYSLKEFPDFTLDRAKLDGFIATAAKFAWALALGVFLVMFIFNLIGFLITFVISGFLLWLLLKTSSRAILFKNAFMVCMYAYTFIFLLNLVLTLLGLNTFGIFSIPLTALIACLFVFMPLRPETAAS